MNQWKTLALLLLLYLISIAPQQRSTSAESFVQSLRIMAEQVNTKPVQETSPSPSPDAGVDKSVNKSNSEVNKDIKNPAVSSPEICEGVSNKCHNDVKNFTACLLPYAEYGTLGLLVLNDGESSLKLNVTVLPMNSSYNDTEIPGHQSRKINVSSKGSGSSSIVLSAIGWTCAIQIHTGVPVSSSFPPYIAYVTPINGAYVLVATAVLIGAMWACCKLGKKGRHLDGVPYQELEMGQQQSATSVNVESADGWDQSWDDNWDEENAVKSPSGNYRRGNGVNSTPAETNGWGNDWEE